MRTPATAACCPTRWRRLSGLRAPFISDIYMRDRRRFRVILESDLGGTVPTGWTLLGYVVRIARKINKSFPEENKIFNFYILTLLGQISITSDVKITLSTEFFFYLACIFKTWNVFTWTSFFKSSTELQKNDLITICNYCKLILNL